MGNRIKFRHMQQIPNSNKKEIDKMIAQMRKKMYCNRLDSNERKRLIITNAKNFTINSGICLLISVVIFLIAAATGTVAPWYIVFLPLLLYYGVSLLALSLIFALMLIYLFVVLIVMFISIFV